MEKIENYIHPKTLFVFDLEFIGDVRNLNSCYIWEIAVFCTTTGQWFEAVVDPLPGIMVFPPPPIPEIPQLTRQFLDTNEAQTWDVVFQSLVSWIQANAMNSIPIFISHNTFRADKPILELECRRYNMHMPFHWYFFDSLHYARRVIRNATGNYSLSGLHEQLFGTKIINAHRARNDVVACISILSHLTNNTYNICGPIYPTYTTALRTIRWIGQKAEEILFDVGIYSVEELYQKIMTTIRKNYLLNGAPIHENILAVLVEMLGNKLPPDNIRHIAEVLSNQSKCVYCHTFMESTRSPSPNSVTSNPVTSKSC